MLLFQGVDPPHRPPPRPALPPWARVSIFLSFFLSGLTLLGLGVLTFLIYGVSLPGKQDAPLHPFSGAQTVVGAGSMVFDAQGRLVDWTPEQSSGGGDGLPSLILDAPLIGSMSRSRLWISLGQMWDRGISTVTGTVEDALKSHFLTYDPSAHLNGSRRLVAGPGMAAILNETTLSLARAPGVLAGQTVSHVANLTFDAVGDVLSVQSGPAPGDPGGCATLDMAGQIVSSQIPPVSPLQGSGGVVVNETAISLSTKDAFPLENNTYMGVLCNAAVDHTGRLGAMDVCPVVRTITGTANRVLVTGSDGALTLTTPQDIDPAASVSFASISSPRVSVGNVSLTATGDGYSVALPSAAPATGSILTATSATTLSWVLPNVTTAATSPTAPLFYATNALSAASTAFVTLFGTGIGATVIPAGTLIAGRRIRASFRCVDGLGGVAGYAAIYLGGTQVAATPSHLSGGHSRIDAELFVRSVVSGTACVLGNILYETSGVSTAIGGNSACFNVNNAVDISVDVRLQWALFTGSTSCYYSTLEIL